jgi:hypothetical protein
MCKTGWFDDVGAQLRVAKIQQLKLARKRQRNARPELTRDDALVNWFCTAREWRERIAMEGQLTRLPWDSDAKQPRITTTTFLK